MTLDDVLQDLIQHLDSQGDSTIAWEQVREWPEGAVEIFQNAGWIEAKALAKTVVCPGSVKKTALCLCMYPRGYRDNP